MVTSNKPHVGAGNVPIVLDGEQLELRPSLGAALAISRGTDGIRGAMNRVLQLDLDAVVMVIGQGLGYENGSKDLKELPEKVWRTGLTDDSGGLVERCVAYLRLLSSGGRPPIQGTGGAENPPK